MVPVARILAITLFVLLVIVAGAAVMVNMEKLSLEKQNQDLQSQLADKDSQLLTQAKKVQQESKDLNDRVAKAEKEKQQSDRSLKEIKGKVQDLSDQLKQATDERDSSKSRLATIRQERDELMEKMKNVPEKIVYKDRVVEKPVEAAASAVMPTGDQDEGYWANVVKEKAALQLEIEKIKGDLDQTVLQLSDLKKQNSDLQLEVTQLTNEKDEISRRIKYGEDLANNLSMELARARNDQKFTIERSEKMKQENIGLQGQIKTLTTTKVALERTIAHLNADRDSTQKKLNETENVIQGRIDEIWQIKQNLDQKISDLPAKNMGDVELPPIIVNAQGQNPPAAKTLPATAKTQGSVVSINEVNNFVIVDLGEGDGSQVGKSLKVYRGSKNIATLEVIQVRKDISAADIKQKSTQIKVGDIVR